MVMKVKIQKVVTTTFDLWALMADHQQMVEGNCNSPKSCRWNVATYRVMPDATKVWVDGGHIRYTRAGWRWEATTPKPIKADLIELDKWVHLPKAKRAVTPVPFLAKGVYRVKATRMSRARKATEAELAKMKRRRVERIAAGKPDKKPVNKFTFHNRVTGYA